MNNQMKARGGVFLLVIGLILVAGPAAVAGASTLWGDLAPGPYDIGFRTVEAYDYSRTMRAKFDYFGQPQEGERARPVQVCLWYPARASEDETGMTYGEYLFPSPADDTFHRFVSTLQARQNNFLVFLFGNNQGLVLDALNLDMAAVRDAEAADGAFPLIIYHGENARAYSENFVLCEFLASHGFVVAATHSVGAWELNPAQSASDLEAQVRDREFGLTLLRQYEFIDFDRLGLIGQGMGGLAALVTQMRNSDVEAVVSLFGAELRPTQREFVEELDFFVPRRATAPTMIVYPNDTSLVDLEAAEACKYAERSLLAVDDLLAAGLGSDGALQYVMTDTSGAALVRPVHDRVCTVVLAFMKGHLTDAPDKAEEIAVGYDGMTLSTREKVALPPTDAQFIGIVRSRGGLAAAEIYERFQASDPGALDPPEANLNILGYQAMQRGQTEDALAIFRINADAHPESPNVWDSYADGCQAAGDTATAIKCYQTVLELLPNDTLTQQALKDQLHQLATDGLARLQPAEND